MHGTWGRIASKILGDGVCRFGERREFRFAVWGYGLADGLDVLLKELYSLVKAYILV
jgi:hypothetical protein